MGLKVVYTTPLKALSNQKFQDFTQRYGGDRVGLLTGDVVINRGAAITIMTTEVFRNMVYDPDSYNQLSNLFMVCFDEFHYMNDPGKQQKSSTTFEYFTNTFAIITYYLPFYDDTYSSICFI